MKLSIASNALNNIAEIWAYGENALVVYLKDGKKVRVTAARNIYSGSQYKFAAMYEAEINIEISEATHAIWTSIALSSAGGDTIEHCLENALRFLNTIGA
jgi:hypothetical protein